MKPPTGHHPPCGAAWGGHSTEHCTECHQTFSGTKTGDAHRVGAHDPPGQRRCLNDSELRDLGLWTVPNVYGTEVWHGTPNKAGVQKRRPVRMEDLP